MYCHFVEPRVMGALPSVAVVGSFGCPFRGRPCHRVESSLVGSGPIAELVSVSIALTLVVCHAGLCIVRKDRNRRRRRLGLRARRTEA